MTLKEMKEQAKKQVITITKDDFLKKTSKVIDKTLQEIKDVSPELLIPFLMIGTNIIGEIACTLFDEEKDVAMDNQE